MEQDYHSWTTVGEDTGGYVEWCVECGAIKDSGGEITFPMEGGDE